MTMELHNLQQTFQHYLLGESSEICQSVVLTENVSIDTRLNIYKNAYTTRLLDALACNYPCLETWLGDDQFEALGLAYIEAHPSTFPSIRWFGDKLPAFLAEDDTDPYLAELADFEWKMALAFDAQDSHLVMMEHMAAVPPEAWASMTMIPQPTVQRMNYEWNVVSIWQSLTKKEEPVSPVRNAQKTSWVLWRVDYITHFYAMSEDETWAMDQILAGANFGELCEGLCAFVDEQEVGMRAAGMLKGWIQSGILARIES